ncbi:MAG: hypothetical protein Q4B60_00495 [Erysipelotrichaceae bacterium]|nr:hypothetical protein [Erysipelotrichaceae bacterium]
MKKIKTLFLVSILLVITVLTVSFDFEKNKVSLLDNRMLTELNVISSDNIDNYISDRVGLRKEMVGIYNWINAKLFNVSTHPSKLLGKDNNLFPMPDDYVEYGSYHEKFLNSIKIIQDYCLNRGVDFYFVLDPSKAVIESYLLPDGVNVNSKWIEEFVEKSKEKGINIIDNYSYLKEISENGERLYNDQYDVYHWSDYGAYMGINNILENIKNDYNNIGVNKLSDFNIEKHNIKGSLFGSQFIDEEIDYYTPKLKTDNHADAYKENLNFHEDFEEFYYFETGDEEKPNVLAFEGSYLISEDRTERFIANNFNKTIAVHNYQNIYNIDYYFNIFQPDIVIFEIADYVLIEYYFSEYYMETMKLQEAYSDYSSYKVEEIELSGYEISQKGMYEEMIVPKELEYTYAYLITENGVYDFYDLDNDYMAITLLSNTIENADESKITFVDTVSQIKYECKIKGS